MIEHTKPNVSLKYILGGNSLRGGAFKPTSLPLREINKVINYPIDLIDLEDKSNVRLVSIGVEGSIIAFLQLVYLPFS